MNLKKSFIVFVVGILVGNPLMSFSATNYVYSLDNASNVSSNISNRTNKNLENEVLQGSVSVDIVPYCENWSSQYAFNQINRIGSRLLQANELEQHMQFVVVDNEDANATTNINNVISVYSGLLKYVETEDELAFVVGHEMGHVTKSHVRKSIVRNTAVAITGVAGSALSVLGILGNSAKMTKAGAIVAGGALVGEVGNKKLSRGQETDSDYASIDYMVNAGYNPLATISILNKISGNYFDFFSDHPSGEKRIKNAYKYISKNYPEYIEKGYNSTSYDRAMKIINPKK